MKKVKKLFAVLLTLAMVLGMSMTTFAAPKDSATITVENAENATLSYVQVIRADPTTATGWAFTSNAIAQCYIDALNVADAQSAIRKMTSNAATSGELGKALSNVANIAAYKPMVQPQTVTEAGVYAIKATEAGFTYNNMAVYVAFTEIKDENGNVINEYPSLADVSVAAKKTPIEVSKESTDTDKVVTVGDIVTYTIKTNVPYINPNDVDKTFYIYDEITGADYYLTGEGSVATVKIGNDIVGTIVIDSTNAHRFEVELSHLIDNANSNAGKEVVVTYTAKVTAVTVHNDANAGHKGGSQYGSDSEDLYTGQITLTKYNEDGTKTLEGAGFEVFKDESTTALTFVQDMDGNGKAIKGSYTYSPNGTITEVFTGEDGKVIVKGLNIGTYHFEEKTAPKGYSINADGADASIEIAGEKVTAVIQVSSELNDTKLSALPGTGGIGTTIFTISGCLLMLGAAAMFFSSRRKAR